MVNQLWIWWKQTRMLPTNWSLVMRKTIFILFFTVIVLWSIMLVSDYTVYLPVHPPTSYYRGLHHQPCWVSKWVAWPLNNLTLSLWYAIYKHLWHTSLHWLKDLSLRKKSTLVVQSLTIWLGNQRIGCPVGQVISDMLIN